MTAVLTGTEQPVVPVQMNRASAATEERYTVQELARKVGMSPRNIRSHQARKLLSPPVRKGRVAFYDASHVRRLETIKSLQKQGFNLVSIEAILGARGADPGNQALSATLRRFDAEHPALAYALARHGVFGRGEDGAVRVARPRVLRSALDLQNIGLGTVSSLRVLGELLDSVHTVARGLVGNTSSRVLALRPAQPAGRADSWEKLDSDVNAVAQGLTNLLTEAFRLAVENCAEAAVTELAARQNQAALRAEVVSAPPTI
jgi:DNA-binding transcriptional MerR regulator